MISNSETILSSTTHSGVEQTTVTGEAYKGDGFYGRSDGLHTVQYTFTSFTGDIIIQGTLASNPAEEDWFEVHSYSTNIETASKIASFTGNYVWIRAQIIYTAGSINSIKLNH
jgi:hypothetical protein